MLIDTGADVTLLPSIAIETLGLVPTGERYRLESFDGMTSESDTVRAVLVFLGGRFRGRYLNHDSEVGILGRDVLNHVRLRLNGPGRFWDRS